MNRRDFIRFSMLIGSFIGLSGFNKKPFQTTISEDELLGKGSPTLFGDGYKLRKEAHEAFLDMKSAASKDKINPYAVSAYRSYDRQKYIWEGKFDRYTGNGLTAEEAIKKIINYSTIPGTSRHHWGTDLDLIDMNQLSALNVLSPKNFAEGGPYHELKLWMNEHAETYGFYEVYTDDSNRKGFKYEPWHFSYKELAQPFLKRYLELDILQLLKDSNFKGSEAFTSEFIKGYIEEHILDINPVLLP